MLSNSQIEANSIECTLLLVALWTMKVMEIIPEKHLLFFFCIDYTIWPGKYCCHISLIRYEYIFYSLAKPKRCTQFSSCSFLGWNHRGVYVLSRTEKLENKVKRKLSTRAHRRMRMDYHR